MDKVLRAEIVAEVRRSMTEIMETYNEEWVTAEQLCDQVPFFKREWMRKNWRKLPSERMGWTDKDGKPHTTQRCYPKKKILRMIAEGKYRNISLTN